MKTEKIGFRFNEDFAKEQQTKIKDFFSFLLCLILIPFWLLAAVALAAAGKVCDLFRYLRKKI